ncbi:MAG: methionyl-tRNA formyltransferase [Patescibacteria group bacterium]
MRIIFFGTPAYSVGFLYSLIAADMSPIAVVSQPDRPVGRDKEILPTPVKELAEANNIPVLQPENVNDPQSIANIKALNPDLIVVVAFGQIISKDIIDIPKRGCINVHPSLLPLLRGATPLQGAILQGLSETGITIMLMDEKMDHGPILAQLRLPLAQDETYVSLAEKTIDLGRTLLVDTIKKWTAGAITSKEQDHTAATFTKLLKKDSGKITADMPVIAIQRMMRALQPWPGVWMEHEGKRVKILSIGQRIAHTDSLAGVLFTNTSLGNGTWLSATDGALELTSVQPEGKAAMSGEDFARGYIRSNTNPTTTI